MRSANKPICIILVGGTGVGKTTLVDKLREKIDFILVDRRSLVDDFVIPNYENDLKRRGLKYDKESREFRFDSTAWYAKKGNPGLAKLVKQAIKNNKQGKLIIVDNLRGEIEINYALKNIPEALFICLDALDKTRIFRIIGREASFDKLKGELKEKYIQAKKIVEKESQSYDLKKTFLILKKHSSKTLYFNTDKMSSEEIFSKTINFLFSKLDRITKFNLYCLNLPLRKKLVWGKKNKLTSLDHLLLEIQSGDFCGYAEAIPRPTILGETKESITKYYNKILPILNDFEISKRKIDLFFKKEFKTPQDLSAKAALNCALYEVLASKNGVSVEKLIGLPKKKVGVCYILSQPENALQLASEIKKFIEEGILGFKIKLTGDIKRDIAIIETIKQFSKCSFYLDGNELYSFDEAKKIIDAMSAMPNILYVEELISIKKTKERQYLIKHIKDNKYKLKIVGDDSCKNFNDIKKQIRLKTISMVNLKVPRTGITEGLRILDYCYERKMPVMIGSHASYIIGAYYSYILSNHKAVKSKLNELIYWLNVSPKYDIILKKPQIINNKIIFNNFPALDKQKLYALKKLNIIKTTI